SQLDGDGYLELCHRLSTSRGTTLYLQLSPQKCYNRPDFDNESLSGNRMKASIKSRAAVGRILLVLAILLCFAGPTCADFVLSMPRAATSSSVGDFTTDTFTIASSDPTDKIIGFNFTGPFGIFGSMNQVNPSGQLTVFGDNNSILPLINSSAAEDSQFD